MLVVSRVIVDQLLSDCLTNKRLASNLNGKGLDTRWHVAVDGRNPEALGLLKTSKSKWEKLDKHDLNCRISSMNSIISTEMTFPICPLFRSIWYDHCYQFWIIGTKLHLVSLSEIDLDSDSDRFCWVQTGLQTLLGIFEHSNLEIGEVGDRRRLPGSVNITSWDVSWFTLPLWISSFKQVFFLGQFFPWRYPTSGFFALPDVCFFMVDFCVNDPNSRASFEKKMGWRFSTHSTCWVEFCFSFEAFSGLLMGKIKLLSSQIFWVFPKIGGNPPKWMVYNGKPY